MGGGLKQSVRPTLQDALDAIGQLARRVDALENAPKSSKWETNPTKMIYVDCSGSAAHPFQNKVDAMLKTRFKGYTVIGVNQRDIALRDYMKPEGGSPLLNSQFVAHLGIARESVFITDISEMNVPSAHRDYAKFLENGNEILVIA